MRFDEEDNGDSVEQSPLNMTPMIDMVFLLLIFFLAATTISQKQVKKDIELATAKKFSPLSAPSRDIVINITKGEENNLIVMGKAYNERELVDMLKKQSVGGKPPRVLLRWDKQAMGWAITQATDACAQAGIREISAAATPHQDSGAQPQP